MQTFQAIQRELEQTSPEFQAYVAELERIRDLHFTVFDPTLMRPVRMAVVIARAFDALRSSPMADLEAGEYPNRLNLDSEVLLHNLLDMCEAVPDAV